jgi:Na+/proline symporter
MYRLNYLTFSDYFQVRFSQQTELISAIMMIPSYFGWIAAQLVALATILHVITGLPILAGLVVCSLLVMFYTYIGGMWAVSITDFVQTIIILVGLAALTIIMVSEAGGMAKIKSTLPDNFFRVTPNNTFKDWMAYIAAWFTIGLGSIPQQDVFQRVMSAKSERTAVLASYTSSVMYLTIAAMPLLIAICGKILYPELATGTEEVTQMMIPNMVLKHGSLMMQIMFFGALLSAILSTASGAILAPATVVGENIIKPYFPGLTDMKLLYIMRISVVAITVISCIMASLNSDIYELVADSSALSLVSLFVPLVCGLYWKRASDLGALLSMTMGLFVWLYARIVETDETIVPSLLLGLAASILGMVIGTIIKPRTNAEIMAEKQAHKASQTQSNAVT